MDKTSLGDRMKKYEATTKTTLLPRTPTIIRVDGKAFHTWTRSITTTVDPSQNKGPYSHIMHDAMMYAMMYAMTEMQNVRLAYTQSDEISFLLNDWSDIQTQQWFNGTVQKIASVTASLVTGGFIQALYHKAPILMVQKDFPAFDARVFQLPKEEVANYFIWRQKDATRNSINMLGQYYFSHKEMHGKSTSEVQDMLMEKYKVNWNDLELWKRRGSCAYRKIEKIATNWKQVDHETIKDVSFVERSKIFPDDEIPIFTSNRDYIERHL